MINFEQEREWADVRNAVGFVAECARLVLPFCALDGQFIAAKAIEAAERYANGATLDHSAITAPCYDISTTVAAAADITYLAAYGARSKAIEHITTAVDRAVSEGADAHEIHAAFARWVVRDLSGGRELPAELRQAAGAAVVAGAEAIARGLLA